MVNNADMYRQRNRNRVKKFYKFKTLLEYVEKLWVINHILSLAIAYLPLSHECEKST